MFVLASAGHVDHGKSTLLRVLTGMEPDRLLEEKKRGMTIDLGFLWLDSPFGRIGIVDVPGHHDFMKNMLAGMYSADAFLFVVAADDGWMPQSEEHFEILQSLGIKKGLVILSKVDLVSESRLAEVEAQISKRVGNEIPILPFHKESEALLANVKTALWRLLESLPKLPIDLGSRFWIDRSFVTKGEGTVVTGTLREGVLNEGDSLYLWPSGKTVTARSLRAYHSSGKRFEPVSRVAIQLSQLGSEKPKRGMLLSHSKPHTSNKITVSAHLFGKLKKNLSAKFYIGTMEEKCLIVPHKTEGILKIKFQRPIPVRYGDRFVIRSFGGESLLYGGVIIDPFGRVLKEESRELDPIKRELALVGYLDPRELPKALEARLKTMDLVWLLNPSQVCLPAENYKVHVQTILKSLSSSKPQALNTIAKASKIAKPLLEALLLDGIKKGLWITESGGYTIYKVDHGLTKEESSLLAFCSKGPMSQAEILNAKYSSNEVDALLRKKKIVGLIEKHYLSRERYETYRARVKEYLVKNGQGKLADLKPLINCESRRDAVRILEQMDRDRLTYLKDGVRKILSLSV